jgi:hypothetical protein
MFDLGSPVLPENRSALFDVMAFGRPPMTNTADLLQAANSRKRLHLQLLLTPDRHFFDESYENKTSALAKDDFSLESHAAHRLLLRPENCIPL